MTEQGSQQVPISEAMRLATDHHQAGRLPEAEAIYRAVLESDPKHAGANYNLALIALQRGRATEAVPVIKAALQAAPDNAAYWLNYAVALAGSGEVEAARDVLLQARKRGHGGAALTGLLAQVQRMTEASGTTVVETVGDAGAVQQRSPNLSALLALYRQGQFAQVAMQARELWREFPESVPLVRLLGHSLLAQDKFDEAREVLSRGGEAIATDPGIHNLHGLALRRLRRNEEARDAFERALALDSDNFETLLNASANAVTLHDAVEARRYAERALSLKPESVDALRVLADSAVAGGSYEEAADLYRRGLVLDPKAADLYVNLGDALISLERSEQAIVEIERALELRPDYAPARLGLGQALYELGETAEARIHFRAASDLAPSMAEAHTAYLFCLSHDETVTPEQSLAEHIRIGELIEAPLRRFQRAHANDRDPERGLRVGFVSGDLREHPVAYVIEPVWQAMHGGRHQVFAYANIRAEDEVSDRLRALTDSWLRVERLDDEALAEQIRRDRIDILFDLSGHTTLNRLTVFARKPAPIQVTWIGYPATTGLKSIDYRFARSMQEGLDPTDAFFCEKPVRFRSRGFQPDRSAPDVGRLPALATGRITFGSFNRPSKIGESTVELWSRVLAAVPGSRLLIAAAGEARTQERLRALFEAQGVAAQRLTFRPRMSMAEYLAMHSEVDIALDTFPYTGGTTTNHALWMGVPVLTLVGNAPQQRQAAGALRLLGMSDWAVQSEGAYVEWAKAAATDLEALDRLRQSLRPLMAAKYEDSRSDLSRDMDTALQTMWRRWCAGLPPESFTVSA